MKTNFDFNIRCTPLNDNCNNLKKMFKDLEKDDPLRNYTCLIDNVIPDNENDNREGIICQDNFYQKLPFVTMNKDNDCIVCDSTDPTIIIEWMREQICNN